MHPPRSGNPPRRTIDEPDGRQAAPTERAAHQAAPTERAAQRAAPTQRATRRGGVLRRPVGAPRWSNTLIHAGWSWLERHGATGPGDAKAVRFGAFGDGSCLAFPPGALFGERWIRIGDHTLIGPNVSLSAGMVPGQEMVTDPVVRIGSRCMIGRGSHIVGHFSIDIGDDVHTGPYVYITDQNHGYEDPDQVVHAQWPSDVPVRIGSGSWLGTGVVVLPGADMGRNVVVGAGSVVRGAFPDHCVIAGVPARIVRQYRPESGWVDVPRPPTLATGQT